MNKKSRSAVFLAMAAHAEFHNGYGQPKRNVQPNKDGEKLPNPGLKKHKFKRNKKRGW